MDHCDEQRRLIIGAGAALGAALLLPAGSAARAAEALDPIPPLAANPTPGKPGDFHFLHGEWRIAHRQRKDANSEWVTFAGEATCWTILKGVGSVEELRIPARDFSGMGLRMLDVEKKVWSDFWVNAKSGVLTTPGMTGSFENGAGIFFTDDPEAGAGVKYAGIWDKITPTSCRWRQASTRDSGRTWEQSWIMDWSRVG
jgi:hypothetical protein